MLFHDYPQIDAPLRNLPGFGGDSDTIPAFGGWEVHDTTDWIIENVNEGMSKYRENILDVIQWDGERNDAPLQSLLAIKTGGNNEYWALYRENPLREFGSMPSIVEDGPITADTKAEIIRKALAWQRENPVETAPDILVETIDIDGDSGPAVYTVEEN